MQDYEVGGIKIIDIVNFTTALKVTWIRRCFQTHSRWITLFESVTDLTTKQLVIFYSKKETKYKKYVLERHIKQLANTSTSIHM